MHEFRAAPWPAALKLSSALVTALVGAVDYGAFRVAPPSGVAHVVGTIVAISLPITLLMSVLFVITGFALDSRRLSVRRMLWPPRIELAGLREIRRDPQAIKGSKRLYGNAGLFSFSGVYRSRRLGRYRLFATDLAKAVVIVHATGTVVVTPADPDAFIDCVRRLYPAARSPHEEARSTPHPQIHPIS